MRTLLLIKLGGSIVTDKSKEFTAREDFILRLASEIKSASKKFKGKIIIGHGAGSFAHTPAAKYQTKKGLIGKDGLYGMSVVEDAARQLNAIVVKNFLTQNVAVFPFSPASFILSDAQIYSASYLDTVLAALKIGQIPVVYGDVILDKNQGVTIFSTEKVFAAIAVRLHKLFKIKMIYVTDVDGVYDSDKKNIPLITSKNFESVKKSIIGASTVDVTGGMLHKVEESLYLAKKYGIETQILNGKTPGSLKKAILGVKTVSTKIV